MMPVIRADEKVTSLALPQPFLERLRSIIPVPLLPQVEGSFSAKTHAGLRVNTLKTTVPEAKAFLKGMDISWQEVPWCSYALWVPVPSLKEILASSWASEGKLYSQGVESQIPVLVLDPRPGETVLDLCAAPGSKTTQIAAHMNNEGTLVANEPVRDRFFRLRSVVDLMGARVTLKMVDGQRFDGRGTLFNRILVDAPCSSEGRFNVHEPKTTRYWSVRKVHEMAHKQKGLLLNASRLLKPGGILVYATCTFAVEENEAVVDWLLRKTQGLLSLEPVALDGVPSYLAQTPVAPQAARCLRVLPDGRMEGFFTAKFVLTG
ncbi:MAG: RsmB/NOP family class I SAM-dependent RNA methyltransferase [Candidatus Omnitrophota bacterium]|nr:RsmB/NOP family class I SAM-dependent RNA methyltransferase [Candidatus Omnitrophota bacterium]